MKILSTSVSEWKNYRLTRKFPIGFSRAVSRLFRAVVYKLDINFRGKSAIPPYLLEDKLVDAHFSENEDLNAQTISISIPVKLCSSVMDWANQFQFEYESFVIGKSLIDIDPEHMWSLHQFAWVFALALANPGIVNTQLIDKYITAWISTLGTNSKHPSWRSYSMAERLCNWLNCIRITGYSPPEPVVKSMQVQICHLLQHLEEYRFGNTNNHLIVNGRALYLFGSTIRNKHVQKIGRSILINELNRQITSDGFLNEGSSHYQLLTTKNYLESLTVASETNDRELSDVLAPSVAKMLKACNLFMDWKGTSPWQFPHIGDISPDMPPQIFNRSLQFWDYVIEAISDKTLNVNIPWFIPGQKKGDNQPILLSGWNNFPDSGYFRWDGKQVTIWWHARKAGLRRSHAHNDWGSFELHMCGEPVFIDTGRDSYNDVAEGRFDGKATLQHNCLAIDGFEQSIFLKRDLYTSDYLLDGADVEVENGGRDSKISMKIPSYRRLKRPVTHTREFICMDREITINDRLEGTGEHLAVIAFHLHPDVSCSKKGPDNFLLKTPGGRSLNLWISNNYLKDVTIKRGGPRQEPGGYCSVRYGACMETTSLVANYQVALPVALQFKISIP